MQQQNNLAQTRSSVATNLIALYKALGGGWEIAPGPAVRAGSTQDEMKERTNWGDMLSQPPRAGRPPQNPHRAKPLGSSAMAKKLSKRALQVDHRRRSRVAVVAFIGFRYWQKQKNALPKGIASGNGRIEAKLVDVAAKEPLRVKEILVDEGALVKPGQVLVRMDTATLESQLAEAKANVAAGAGEAGGRQGRDRQAEERNRPRQDRGRRARASSSRRAPARSGSSTCAGRRWRPPRPALAEEKAKLQTAKQEVEVAQANVATIQTRIDDATLKSPVTGRVLYRLAEPGEVLGAGGKALTLVNLDDVYMEIFLPSEQAAQREDRRRGADHRRLRCPAARSPGT